MSALQKKQDNKLNNTPTSNSIIPGLNTTRIPINPKIKENIRFKYILSFKNNIASIDTIIGVVKLIAAFFSSEIKYTAENPKYIAGTLNNDLNMCKRIFLVFKKM